MEPITIIEIAKNSIDIVNKDSIKIDFFHSFRCFKTFFAVIYTFSQQTLLPKSNVC